MKTSHFSLLKLTLFGGLLALAPAACASQTTPPAASPATEAGQSTGPGVTEQQAPQDGIVFVDREHKDPTTHEDTSPVTKVTPNASAGKPH